MRQYAAEDRSSASVSESKESAVNNTATIKAETESVQAENSQPAAEQSPAPRILCTAFKLNQVSQ